MAKSDIAILMADDLLNFQKLLNDHMGGYIECGEISKVAEKLNKSRLKKGTEECWAFEKVPIIFKNLDLGGDICPEIEDCFLGMAVLKLIVEMSGYRNIPNDTFDPITPIPEKKLPGFNVQLIIAIGDFHDFIAKCSWHFDLHEDGNDPKFNHPLYHAHFGGKEINQGQLKYGNVLIIESPRLLHPPMDIILAIDFVLGNFYSRNTCKAYNTLLEAPLYHKMVKNSRERFWRPYFLGLASNFAVSHNFQSINHLSVDPPYAKNLLMYSKKH